jgi:hypothetical protein
MLIAKYEIDTSASSPWLIWGAVFKINQQVEILTSFMTPLKDLTCHLTAVIL